VVNTVGSGLKRSAPVGVVGLSLWTRSDTRVGAVLPTVVVVLLVLAATAFAPSPTGLPRQWNADGVTWWMVALPAAAWLGGLTLVLTRTMPRPRYRAALLRAGALELALLIVGAVLLARLGRGIGSASLGRDADTLPLPLIPLPPIPLAGAQAVLALFGLAVAAGLVLLLWSAWESRRRVFLARGALVRDARYGHGRRRNAQHDRLVLEALARARAALVSDEDVRRAVIAAYASLERTVTERGADRSRAQTPAEFLHAALDSGVVGRHREAEELLSLFHRARFSHLPMGDQDRERALDCLAALQQDLSVTGDRPR